LLAAIREAGGAALALPMLEIQALVPEPASAAILAALSDFDIAIFISTNAVRAACARWRESGTAWPNKLLCLATGTGTAQALAREGIAASSAVAAMNSEELLALDVLAAVQDKRIVIFKGEGGRGLLGASLRARGARVSECILYRRVPPAVEPAELQRILAESAIDTVLISSAEGLANLVGLLGEDSAGTMTGRLVLVVPGERIAQLARASGFTRVEIAANATDGAMLAALHRRARRNAAGPERS
jgi:uroporphyrinogen-III synthase